MEQFNQTTQPQDNNSQMPKPNNNMVMAILCTVCFCLPFGIYAIIKASKVNSYYMAGMYKEAMYSAIQAKKWSTIGIIAGAVFEIIYFIIAGSVVLSSAK